jgi:hypothetical protein
MIRGENLIGSSRTDARDAVLYGYGDMDMFWFILMDLRGVFICVVSDVRIANALFA